MRLVLVNPHSHNFGKMVSGELFRRKSFLKYDYFVDHYLINERSLAFYVDGTRNSFSFHWPIFPKLFCYLELIIWMIINNINPLKVPVYYNLKKLSPSDDILFDFSRSLVDIADKNVSHAPWSQFEGLTFIHFTHYFKDIKKLAERFKSVRHPVVVAENDLANSPYFKKYFPSVKTVYHLPFTFGVRFRDSQPYSTRLNKSVAVGSITRVSDKAFSNFFGSPDNLHPIRNLLYHGGVRYKQELDSYIQGFNQTINVRINPDDTIWTKLAKKYFPFVLLEKFFPTPQITYFRFDIVAKYNSYKMFICPEEVVGLPSIDFVEGMACHCAYFGADDPMYTNLGMIPGVHYICYKKDSLDDFIAQVRYYQKHPKPLADIAQKGYDFVCQHFNRATVAETFWSDMEAMITEFSQNKVVKIQSSFNRRGSSKSEI